MCKFWPLLNVRPCVFLWIYFVCEFHVCPLQILQWPKQHNHNWRLHFSSEAIFSIFFLWPVETNNALKPLCFKKCTFSELQLKKRQTFYCQLWNEALTVLWAEWAPGVSDRGCLCCQSKAEQWLRLISILMNANWHICYGGLAVQTLQLAWLINYPPAGGTLEMEAGERVGCWWPGWKWTQSQSQTQRRRRKGWRGERRYPPRVCLGRTPEVPRRGGPWRESGAFCPTCGCHLLCPGILGPRRHTWKPFRLLFMALCRQLLSYDEFISSISGMLA